MEWAVLGRMRTRQAGGLRILSGECFDQSEQNKSAREGGREIVCTGTTRRELGVDPLDQRLVVNLAAFISTQLECMVSTTYQPCARKIRVHGLAVRQLCRLRVDRRGEACCVGLGICFGEPQHPTQVSARAHGRTFAARCRQSRFTLDNRRRVGLHLLGHSQGYSRDIARRNNRTCITVISAGLTVARGCTRHCGSSQYWP
jgi:hypothetical protein